MSRVMLELGFESRPSDCRRRGLNHLLAKAAGMQRRELSFLDGRILRIYRF